VTAPAVTGAAVIGSGNSGTDLESPAVPDIAALAR
jgi:hypothetical protein